MSVKGAFLSIAIISAFATSSGATLVSFAIPALATEQVIPFSQAAFDAAQKADKPILVHITASWCEVCAAQKQILGQLREDPRFKDLISFNIDFDSQKALVRKFGARMQSTMIVYKGDNEEGRSVGETHKAPIEALLDKAV